MGGPFTKVQRMINDAFGPSIPADTLGLPAAEAVAVGHNHHILAAVTVLLVVGNLEEGNLVGCISVSPSLLGKRFHIVRVSLWWAIVPWLWRSITLLGWRSTVVWLLLWRIAMLLTLAREERHGNL